MPAPSAPFRRPHNSGAAGTAAPVRPIGGAYLRKYDVLQLAVREVDLLVKPPVAVRPCDELEQGVAAERVMSRRQDCVTVCDRSRLVDKADSLIRRGKLDEVRKGWRFLRAAPA